MSEGLLYFRATKYKVYKTFKYYVNTEKLYNLCDPNVFYLGGLLATDGYLNKKHSSVEIGLTGESEK